MAIRKQLPLLMGTVRKVPLIDIRCFLSHLRAGLQLQKCNIGDYQIEQKAPLSWVHFSVVVLIPWMAGRAGINPALQLLQEDNTQVDRAPHGPEAGLDAHKIMYKLNAMPVHDAKCELIFQPHIDRERSLNQPSSLSRLQLSILKISQSREIRGCANEPHLGRIYLPQVTASQVEVQPGG